MFDKNDMNDFKSFTKTKIVIKNCSVIVRVCTVFAAHFFYSQFLHIFYGRNPQMAWKKY